MNKGVDFIGVTVSYMCHDGQGNFLMSKRSTKCRDEHGTWDFGGGGVDLGDSVEKTLLKELKEEYCVEPKTFEFLGYEDLFRTMNGVNTHWVGLLFLVEIDRSKVQNGEPEKFDALEWYHLDALPTPLHSSIPGILSKFKDRLRAFRTK